MSDAAEKCYWIGIEGEGGEFVFAHTANQARYRADRYGYEYIEVRAMRQKELDHCADKGFVSQQDTLDAYGHTWCLVCGDTIYEDESSVSLEDEMYCEDCAARQRCHSGVVEVVATI